MANVSRGFAVGDTVYVWYVSDIDLQFTATSRVVSSVDVNNSTNDAIIKFTVGNAVTDTIAIPRVFTTAALASTAIVNAVIVSTAATVVAEGGANTTLVRTT